MQYLFDESPFMSVNGDPMRDPDEEELGLAGVLKLCVNNFVPQQGQLLTVGDWRSLNKIFGILDEPPIEGQFAFEDKDFNVLKKVVGWTAPLFLRRNSPHLIDSLEAASNKKPGPSADGKSDEPIPQSVGARKE